MTTIQQDETTQKIVTTTSSTDASAIPPVDATNAQVLELLKELNQTLATAGNNPEELVDVVDEFLSNNNIDISSITPESLQASSVEIKQAILSALQEVLADPTSYLSKIYASGVPSAAVALQKLNEKILQISKEIAEYEASQNDADQDIVLPDNPFTPKGDETGLFSRHYTSSFADISDALVAVANDVMQLQTVLAECSEDQALWQTNINQKFSDAAQAALDNVNKLLDEISELEEQIKDAKKGGQILSICMTVMICLIALLTCQPEIACLVIGISVGMLVLDQTGVLEDMKSALANKLHRDGCPMATANALSDVIIVVAVIALTLGIGALAGAAAAADVAAEEAATEGAEEGSEAGLSEAGDQASSSFVTRLLNSKAAAVAEILGSSVAMESGLFTDSALAFARLDKNHKDYQKVLLGLTITFMIIGFAACMYCSVRAFGTLSEPAAGGVGSNQSSTLERYLGKDFAQTLQKAYESAGNLFRAGVKNCGLTMTKVTMFSQLALFLTAMGEASCNISLGVFELQNTEKQQDFNMALAIDSFFENLSSTLHSNTSFYSDLISDLGESLTELMTGGLDALRTLAQGM